LAKFLQKKREGLDERRFSTPKRLVSTLKIVSDNKEGQPIKKGNRKGCPYKRRATVKVAPTKEGQP
jgi:hypothetical protein